MRIGELLRMMTPLDRLLAGLALFLVLIAFGLVSGGSPGSRVEIRSGGRVVFVAPLNEPRRVELSGPLGISVLQIEEGAVRVISSPCRHQVCVKMGAIRHGGEVLACVPNRLVVRVTGTGEETRPAYDFISR